MVQAFSDAVNTIVEKDDEIEKLRLKRENMGRRLMRC